MTDPNTPGEGGQQGDPGADSPWAGGDAVNRPPYSQGPPQQAPYGQQPGYGQSPYGQNPYGAPGQQAPGQQAPGPYSGPSQPQYPDSQYSAPQYPQQQYPQQPYGQQPPGGHGQPAYGSPGSQSPYGQAPADGQTPPGIDQFSAMNRPVRDRKPVQLAAVGAVVAVVVIILAITAFVAPGFAVTKELKQSAVESGVKTILEKDYEASEVTGVSCPDGQKVEKGNTFDCTASVAGAQQKVKVTFLDDGGRYEVGRPTAN